MSDGWMPKRADKIARKHGATLVNYCDRGCKCGYGCESLGKDCPACKRHWFAGPNRGEPFDSNMGRAVMAEIAAANIKAK